jgi:hypothetical protein
VIFNTTHTDKETSKEIDTLLGKPFTLLQSIKLKGTGSKRMIIDEVSVGFKNIMNTVSDLNYGNIELREKGILVHINKGLRNFSWAIPFYQLHIYKTSGFSIHAQGNFVRFKSNKLLKENKKFIEKLMDCKIKNDEQYDFQSI